MGAVVADGHCFFNQLSFVEKIEAFQIDTRNFGSSLYNFSEGISIFYSKITEPADNRKGYNRVYVGSIKQSQQGFINIETCQFP